VVLLVIGMNEVVCLFPYRFTTKGLIPAYIGNRSTVLFSTKDEGSIRREGDVPVILQRYRWVWWCLRQLWIHLLQSAQFKFR